MPRKRAKPAAASDKKPLRKYQMPTLLISGDCGQNAGITLWLKGKCVAHSVANGSSFKALWQIVGPMIAPYKHVPNDERLGLVEEGFISFASVKGSLTLGRRRGLMQAAFEAGGFERIEYPLVATWQSHIFNHKRPPDTKEASMRYAIDVLGLPPTITDDVADAACMARYFLDERVTTHENS